MLELNINDVISVYCGKAGECCCGCCGTHTYKNSTRKEASKQCGHEVTDDEINDKIVQRVINKINKEIKNNNKDLIIKDDFVSVDKGTRRYIAYLAGKEVINSY
jgi:arginase family enzyme